MSRTELPRTELPRADDSGADVPGAVDLRPVLRLAQPGFRRFLPGLLAGVLSAGFGVGLLAVSAWLITRAAEMPPILYLSMAVVGVRAFALGRAVFRYLERLASHDAAFRQLTDVRLGLLARMMPLAPAGLTRTRRGDLLTRLVRDVDDLQDLPLRVVQPVVTAVIVAVLAVAGVALLHPMAAACLAAGLVLAALLGTGSASILAAVSERRLAPLRGELTEEVLETVQNLDVLSAFGALGGRLDRVRDADARLRRATLGRSLGMGVQAAIVALFAGLVTVATLVIGIPALDTGATAQSWTLTGPALAVIVLVPMAVFEVFAVMPAALGAWRQVRSSARRVATAVPTGVPAEIPSEYSAERDTDESQPAQGFETGPTSPVPNDAPASGGRARGSAARPLSQRKGEGFSRVEGAEVRGSSRNRGVEVFPRVEGADEEGSSRNRGVEVFPRVEGSDEGGSSRNPTGHVLELADVAVRWPGAGSDAVSGVSLRLAPGDRVHLAGPSGSGKSTVAMALVRFLEYTGSYRLDGIEAREWPHDRLRKVVGLCQQDPWLFDESIRQNLLFARDTATDDDLIEVLERVGLGEWLAERGGLEARVGERGALVSGGQAQRIALARALLADFEILVIDEPTANVDRETGERLIRDILTAAADDARAVLLISHTPVPSDLVTARVTLPARG
ncbi:amino acid ABC transporter ATP-binding/permease protein [Homoserinimonas sp. OAct 916]|uniref:amino acid ABC transporter ATP-binding/permease protein n=1 Tax=Homoserinimonas sp. OAct 916 TaxID=2211450 RepID=UPI001E41AB7A|nr:thiol reductant ABC exporter subunit CydC [Homoserinimonas sp. OAct 916]